MCKFEKWFYTSNKVDNSQAFEVNRRVVLATRNIGVGHQGLVKFCCVVNMLPPMHENSFQDHLKAVENAAQTAVEKSMAKAADEAKYFMNQNRMMYTTLTFQEMGPGGRQVFRPVMEL